MKTMRLPAIVLPAMLLVMGLAATPANAQNTQERAKVLMPGTASRSFLGVGVMEIATERAKALKLKDEHGVEVTRVEDDSPAAKAGLKVQDLVLEFNGQRVEGIDQFVRLVRETPPGREVKLSVNRGGQSMSVAATIQARRIRSLEMGDMHIAIPEMEGLPRVRAFEGTLVEAGLLGIEAEGLSSQLAEFFGVKEGVLVRSVGKGSAAEKAGMKAGDVIVKIEDRRVATPSEVTRAVRASERKPLPVTVVREKKETSLSVTLDDERGTARPRGRSARVQEYRF